MKFPLSRSDAEKLASSDNFFFLLINLVPRVPQGYLGTEKIFIKKSCNCNVPITM